VSISKYIATFSLLFLVGGCTDIVQQSSSKKAEISHNRQCEDIPGVKEIYKKDIILFGELHGTNEIPSMFGSVACNLVDNQNNKRILIGLELPSSFDRQFARIGKVPTKQIQDDVNRMDFWKGMGDGRHSYAMRQLVLRLITYASDNASRVFLIAFEQPHIDSEGAAAVLSRIKEVQADQTLILVGNYHARKTRMPKGPEYLPLGANLSSENRSVVSLDGRFESGNAWVCLPQCAARSIPSQLNTGRDGQFLELTNEIEGYDGFYHISRLSISDARHGNTD
jgi:hypothetical protein